MFPFLQVGMEYAYNTVHYEGRADTARRGVQSRVIISAVKRSIGFTIVFTITEKEPTRAFSWLNILKSTFTFKTLKTLC